MQPFEQLGLIGCGLMGGSFALALKQAGLVKRVVGYSKSPSTTERARQMGVIDVEAPSALLAAAGADLVLLAMGFVSPVQAVLDAFGVDKDARGNAKATTDFTGGYATSVPKLFAAGDVRRGQSLVVWAIREGRQAARSIDEFLMGTSDLPR